MIYLNLNGQWRMKRTDGHEWTNAIVPGSMYNDLLKAGKLEDPFYRDNEKNAAKLSFYDYEYTRNFSAGEELIGCDRAFLCCDGLDTIAKIFINGIKAAETFNMHIGYEFDIKPLLKKGENNISIIFRSSADYITKKYQEKPIWGASESLKGISYLRKAHYMFGWDWGPVLPDAGIWRDIYIKGCSSLKLKDVLLRQEHNDSEVKLSAVIKIERWNDSKASARITIESSTGELLITRVTDIDGKEAHTTFNIVKPNLWWPNGYGEQPLYRVKVELLCNGEIQDYSEYRIGLRTITVSRKDDCWGESFAFEVNGIEIFAMGADYIPEDNLLSRCGRSKTKRLIENCVRANFNCLRVWGGGVYPEDYFFDLCDEYGIIVWQDLMFACALYEFTKEFKDSISLEVSYNLRRIRHHASLGLICGNNEMEWACVEWKMENFTPKLKADYIKQYEVLFPEIIEQVAPDIFYWPSSPSSGGSFDKPNDENYGDMHDWSVWHGREPFTYFRNRYPRFMSEFGIESFPGIKTIESFTVPSDRNIFSYVMENHQKCLSGNEKIMYYISQYYRFPKDFSSILYLSQIVQAEGLRYGVEHWRRNRGRCMGAIYWQLNDCWPVASWSSIDYFGRWKALHYYAKRFFSPILASACEEDREVSIYVTNDTREPCRAKLCWKLYNEGLIVMQSEKSIELDKFSSLEHLRLDLSNILDSDEKKRSCYLEFILEIDGDVLSTGTVLFVPAKHFKFVPPKLQAKVKETQDKFIIFVTSKAFAKNIELDFKTLDGVLSDNFFDLSANNMKIVEMRKADLSRSVSIEEIKKELTLRSLIDTYV
ncbi:MAG: glycoside hydrolase family 2 protein [Clostridia bacterium]|nr:glycoside hydrolase family 2 protein [Clostridia bacterium]